MADDMTGGADAIVRLDADTSRWDAALNRARAGVDAWSTRVSTRFAETGQVIQRSATAASAANQALGGVSKIAGQFAGTANLAALAAGGLHGALLGVAAVGAGAMLEWASQAKQLNLALIEGARLSDLAADANKRMREIALAAAGAPGTSGRGERLAAGLKEAEGSAQALERRLGEARDRLDQLTDTSAQVAQVAPALAKLFGITDVQTHVGAIDEQTKEVERLRKEYEAARGQALAFKHALDPSQDKALAAAARGLADEIEFQVKTWGMAADEAAVFKLQLRGATDEQLAAARAAGVARKALEDQAKAADAARAAQESLAQRGRQVAESVLTAQERHNLKLRELNELLGANAITQEVYARAAGAAEKQLAGVGRAMSAGPETRLAPFAAAGTVDAYRAVAQHQASGAADVMATAANRAAEDQLRVQRAMEGHLRKLADEARRKRPAEVVDV